MRRVSNSAHTNPEMVTNIKKIKVPTPVPLTLTAKKLDDESIRAGS